MDGSTQLTREMTGARMVVQALKDQGVDIVFGYPGGAVLPIYDEIFQQNDIRHILVRHEQAAVHAAEGDAPPTGRAGRPPAAPPRPPPPATPPSRPPSPPPPPAPSGPRSTRPRATPARRAASASPSS